MTTEAESTAEPLGRPGPSWAGDGALGGPVLGRANEVRAVPVLGPLGLEAAPLWSRIVAFGIDLIGLFFVFVVVVIVMDAFGLATLPEPPADGRLDPLQTLPPGLYGGAFVAQALYYWVWSSLGWSPGKRLCRLRIVNARGERPGPIRGLARALVSLISQIWGLGYLLALPDPAHRTLHDRVARTWVVRVEPPGKTEPDRR